MENTLIDGRYLLLAVAGSGGEAHVYHARDESTGAEVAVRLAKHSREKTEHSIPQTFHDGWVQFLGAGIDAQFGPYQVFELLEGQTLGELVPQGPFDAEDWRVFVDQSLDEVGALHDAGWVHGDLNADNFFATNVRWKLLELPFLRLDPPQGRSTMFGSIYTLAPEQINGAKADIASDIYALGCLYYYAACGTYPHTGKSEVEVAISCLREAPALLRLHAPAIPPDWCDWVMKLIAAKTAERVPSVAAARQLLGVA